MIGICGIRSKNAALVVPSEIAYSVESALLVKLLEIKNQEVTFLHIVLAC